VSNHSSPPRSWMCRSSAFVVIALALLLGAASSAEAHGDEGEMEVLAAEATARPLELWVEVGVVYTNDEDLATEAVVTVTATGPDGATVGPIDVPNTVDAKYGTTFDVPTEGIWTVTVISTGPAAEQTVEVTATADTSPSSSGDTTPTTSSGASTSMGSDTTTPSSSPASTASDDGSESSDEDNGLGILVVIGVVVAGLVAFAVIVLRGRSSAAAADQDSGTLP
jgi:hypothetical protein